MSQTEQNRTQLEMRFYFIYSKGARLFSWTKYRTEQNHVNEVITNMSEFPELINVFWVKVGVQLVYKLPNVKIAVLYETPRLDVVVEIPGVLHLILAHLVSRRSQILVPSRHQRVERLLAPLCHLLIAPTRDGVRLARRLVGRRRERIKPEKRRQPRVEYVATNISSSGHVYGFVGRDTILSTSGRND